MSSIPDEGAPTFPERVGRYELLLPIGTGGMATVYLARVIVVGDVHREVALKLMHPFMQGEDGKSSSISLIEEAKLAVRIRHPNVVPVVEVGEAPHGVFLVMDYVEGDTLSGLNRMMRSKQTTIPLNIAGRILLDALAGLHAAHELKDDLGQPLELVHRDFSPQNILVGVDGISRLTDFGVAKAAGRLGVTSSGIIKGKVAYMAPEQALGKRVDRRCDVWAAGVVAWEILAGRRLYKQEDQVATLLKIVQEPPPRLRSERPDISQALDDVIAEALTMDADKRISSASEFRKRLAEAWRVQGNLAEQIEVGEFVHHTSGPKIDARREQVGRVLRLRARIARVGEAAARAMDETSSPSDVRSSGPPGDETTSAISASSLSKPSDIAGRYVAADLPAIPAPRKGVRTAAFAALAGLAVVTMMGVGVLVLVPSGAGKDDARPPSAVAPTAAPERQLEPEATSPVPAAAPQAPRLVIKSNQPVKTLSLDGKAVQVDSPSEEIPVTLTAEQHEKKLKLEATSVEGGKVSLDVEAGVDRVSLNFPASGATSPAAATRGPRPATKGGSGSREPSGKVGKDSAKAPELPGLAPTPYDNK